MDARLARDIMPWACARGRFSFARGGPPLLFARSVVFRAVCCFSRGSSGGSAAASGGVRLSRSLLAARKAPRRGSRTRNPGRAARKTTDVLSARRTTKTETTRRVARGRRGRSRRRARRRRRGTRARSPSRRARCARRARRACPGARRAGRPARGRSTQSTLVGHPPAARRPRRRSPWTCAATSRGRAARFARAHQVTLIAATSPS